MDTNEYTFEIRGGFNINKSNTGVRAADGNVVGFRLPDGRTVRLIAALEVESSDGTTFDYITSDKEMEDLGFGCLDYTCLDFFPIDEENEDEGG
jgi:predicted butyrate kinase (DUF1464 family)